MSFSSDSLTAACMKKSYRVELAFKKDSREPLELEYVLTPLEKEQARFKGRAALKPQLELSDYTCSAVIDWVDIKFTLGRQTQFQFVKKQVDTHLGGNHHVRPGSRDSGGTTDVFTVRFQEALLPAVGSAIEHVRTVFGLVADPEVTGLEVSVDFTPKDHSDDARARIVGVLMWHMFPGWDYMSDLAARPRFSWGPGNTGTAHLIRWNAHAENSADFVRFNIEDRPAAVDATLYVGRRDGALMWRVQNKTVDRQNVQKGTQVDLPPEKRRARVEVTLGAEELLKVGVHHFSELRSFKFGRLQGTFFRAMLPTFSISKGDPVTTWRDEQRCTKFLNTGVLGLNAMDEAIREKAREIRLDAVAAVNARGGKVNARSRVGTGATATLMAFEELNRRSRIALDALTKRQQKG